MNREIRAHRLEVGGIIITAHRLQCYDDALDCAEKLAKEHPGSPVTIFAAVSEVKVSLTVPKVTKV